MSNYLIALAIAGAMTVPATAQPAQTTPAPPPTNQAQAQAQPVQPVQPQMVKKTFCEENDNPYSHISRICHTVMVPAPAQPAPHQQAQTPQQPSVGN